MRTRPDSMDHRVDAAIAFMTANLHRRLTPIEIAASVQLSPSHLRQRFKVETGMSLGRYLRDLRMRRAKELLKTTFLSVKEIAARVGIQSVNHFFADFRRMHNMTPLQFATRYRRAGRGEAGHRHIGE